MSDDPDLIWGLKDLLARRNQEMQRVQAEFTNFKHTADAERAMIEDQAQRKVLRAIRPVLIELDLLRGAGELTEPQLAVMNKFAKVVKEL